MGPSESIDYFCPESFRGSKFYSPAPQTMLVRRSLIISLTDKVLMTKSHGYHLTYKTKRENRFFIGLFLLEQRRDISSVRSTIFVFWIQIQGTADGMSVQTVLDTDLENTVEVKKRLH